MGAVLNLLDEPRDLYACGVATSGDKVYCVDATFAMSLVLTLAPTLASTLATTRATIVAALPTTQSSFRHNPHSLTFRDILVMASLVLSPIRSLVLSLSFLIEIW
jgi:hypothetical protein